MNAKAQKHPIRTNALRMLGGAVMGGAVTGLALVLLGDTIIDPEDPSTLLALVAGLTYAVTGLMVAIGVAMPRTGALYLNVEDAEELREERPKIGWSAAACILIGLFLLALLLSGAEGGLLSPGIALAVAGVTGLGAAIISIVSHKQLDELTRQINLEASALTLELALFLFGGWAALAHLGMVAWVTPLALVSLLAVLLLVSIFIVAIRKGLMTPR
jgi:hypothetical protein